MTSRKSSVNSDAFAKRSLSRKTSNSNSKLKGKNNYDHVKPKVETRNVEYLNLNK